jgi:hypothetical protein
MRRRCTKRFELGKIVATPGALDALQKSGDTAIIFLRRHVRGDWGEVDQEDQQSNERALEHGLRVLSAYRTVLGTRLWIITEADRSLTTILLPEEY